MKDWNTLYVTILSAKDNLGRQEFLLEWMNNNVGKSCNETGLRGQISFDKLSEHIEHFKKKGFDVVYKINKNIKKTQ